MTTVVTFEPLPESEHQFERVDINLRAQDQVYLVGFRRHPLAGLASNPASASISDAESDTTRDGQRNLNLYGRVARDEKGEARAEAEFVNNVSFSEELVDNKFCIIPADSDEARKVRDVYAAIWLAPGYKVMFLPAEGSKVYYQRAMPGNPKWRKIKQGYGVDLADPLMTVLDDAIHIKIDIRPDKPTSGVELLRKALRFIRRSQPPAQPSHPSSSHTLAPFPYPHHPLVRHIHTEIDGSETHSDLRPYQIAARVSVAWNDARGEKMKDEPEKGDLKELRVEREKVWRQREVVMEMEMENMVRGMEVDINPFIEGKSQRQKESKQLLSPPLSTTATNPGRESQLPPIPEHPPFASDDPDPDNTPARPAPERSKSNTTKSPPQSRESSRELKENKRTNESSARSQSRGRSPSRHTSKST